MKNDSDSQDLSEQGSFYTPQKNLQNFFQSPQPQSIKNKLFVFEAQQHNTPSPSQFQTKFFPQKADSSQIFKEELALLKQKTSSPEINSTDSLLSKIPSTIPSPLINKYLELRAEFLERYYSHLSKSNPAFEVIMLNGGFYEGQLKEGKFNGVGGRVFPNNDVFFGEWTDDEIEGVGIYSFSENQIFETYEGKFEKGNPIGSGQYWLKDGRIYIGTTYDLQLTGRGKLLNSDGSFYQGELRNGVKNGLGYEVFNDGTQYEGSFREGLRHGKGKLTQKSKQNLGLTLYNGDFVKDEIEGTGVMIWPNGNCYDGQWQKGVMHGEGKYTWSNGQVYKGAYANGVKEGYGSGKKFKGQFVNGQVHGQGVFIQKKGVYEKHLWKNGVMQKTLFSLKKDT